MTEQTPLERAARALADAIKAQEPEKGGTFWADVENLNASVIEGTFDLERIARAVLIAVREPSPEMLFAGSRISPLDAPVILQSYQAMIDAASVE